MTGNSTKFSLCASAALLMLQVFLLTNAEAADFYALFDYNDKSEVHLVFSTQTPANEYGKLFRAHPAKALYLDELNHFRLAFLHQTEAFKPAQRRLHRQVFDGLAIIADRGTGGYSQHQDQRDNILADQSGRPVFRSRGAPFSPGPGFMITPQFARQNLVAHEVEILPDKNWYEIPNSSWYQTWYSEGTAKNLSYTIFYDRWEEQACTARESVWRGFPAARSEEQVIGEYANYRMLRGKIDGAMELPAVKQDLQTFISRSERVEFLQYGSNGNGVKTAVYKWSDSNPGEVFVENQNVACEVVFESSHEQSRFPFVLDEKRLIVMGTDLLHRWLRLHKLDHENSECTFSSLVPVGNSGYALFVYSAPDNSLFRFRIDEKAGVINEKPQIVKLSFTPSSMTTDHDGNLVFGSFSVWPLSLDDDEDIVMSVEAIELTPLKSDSKDVQGTILLAQQHYFNVYLATPESMSPEWLGRINVGRHFYQCNVFLAAQQSNLTSDVRDLIKLARTTGNSLSAPRRQSEQEQPGQFVLPDRVHMAVSK